jgi:cytochrome c5
LFDRPITDRRLDVKRKPGTLRLSMSALVLAGALGACGEDEPKLARAPAEPEITDAERASWGGAEIYDEVCDKCHKMGVDGAPELGDTPAWQERFAKGRDTLLQHVHEGFKEMPARGDCEFCSDEQLSAALDFMLEKSL